MADENSIRAMLDDEPTIQAGQQYRDGNGEPVTIMGLTKDFPEYFWSLQGNWYDHSGRFIITKRNGSRYTHPELMRNIDLSKGSKPHDYK